MSSVRARRSIHSCTPILVRHSPKTILIPREEETRRLFAEQSKRKGQILKRFNIEYGQKLRQGMQGHRTVKAAYYQRYALCHVNSSNNRGGKKTKMYCAVFDAHFCDKCEGKQPIYYSMWHRGRVLQRKVSRVRHRDGASSW